MFVALYSYSQMVPAFLGPRARVWTVHGEADIPQQQAPLMDQVNEYKWPLGKKYKDAKKKNVMGIGEKRKIASTMGLYHTLFG